MRTRITPSDELSRIFLEAFLNRTTKVTKVSPNSVLSAIAGGVGEVSKRAIKDIALVESAIFPEYATGAELDRYALRNGIPGRFGTSGSATYVRIVANPGTKYLRATHRIKAPSAGITFELTEDVTIPTSGYVYGKVRSVEVGSKANVDPHTIVQLSNAPAGHKYITNEYMATGGRDSEDDELFLRRIRRVANMNSSSTLAKVEQAFMMINPNVLKILFYGINDNGKSRLAIITQNGAELTASELATLLDKAGDVLALADLKSTRGSYKVVLENVQYQPIDVSFRALLDSSYNPDDIRKEIQIRFSKYNDYTKIRRKKIEWDDLLEIVKTTKGVKYVSDKHFVPQVDIDLDEYKVPRFRGFIVMDLDGTVISNESGTLNPFFYPNNSDFIYQRTILQ